MSSFKQILSPTRVACALLVSFMLWPQPGLAGELALKCIYDVLSEVHAAMMFCGEQIDDASEATFSDLRASLKKFINENARVDSHKIGLDYEGRIAEMVRQRADFCVSRDYPVFKNWFRYILTLESATQIHKRLESPSDPMAGDCL